MIDRDRVSRTTIDETGRQSSDFCFWTEYQPSGSEQIATLPEGQTWTLVPVFSKGAATLVQSNILAAANAANYYGDDAVRFANEVDKATEFLIGRVKAAGGDKRRFARRRERRQLTAEAMAHAGVPENTWKDWLKAILSLGFIALPTGPWALVIQAVLVAAKLYFGGEA